MKCESCTKYDDCRTGSGLTWPCGAYRPKAGSGTDIEKLIEDLRIACAGNQHNIMGVAATALSTLQIENQALRNSANGFKAENEKMQKQLNEFSEFLCHMTGGLLSKTNYTAQEMISAAEDYQQRVCGECDLRAENEKLRAELEQVKAERDAAVNEVEWVSVDDRLPETAGEYLVVYHPCHWDNVSAKICVGIDSFRGKTAWAKKKYQRVTHWMPLPAPPAKVDES